MRTDSAMDYIFIFRWEKNFRATIWGEREVIISNDFDKVYCFHCLCGQEKPMIGLISHLGNSKGSLSSMTLVTEFLPGPLDNSWTFYHVYHVCRWLPQLFYLCVYEYRLLPQRQKCNSNAMKDRKRIWPSAQVKWKQVVYPRLLLQEQTNKGNFLFMNTEDIINFMRRNATSSQSHNHIQSPENYKPKLILFQCERSEIHEGKVKKHNYNHRKRLISIKTVLETTILFKLSIFLHLCMLTLPEMR